MRRTRVSLLTDQASAILQTELRKVENRSGDIPRVDTTGIIAKALKFLQDHRVPVTGYDILNVSLVLQSSVNPSDEVSVSVPLQETSTVEENTAKLRTAIADFTTEHGVPPIQSYKLHVRFLLDETQITG